MRDQDEIEEMLEKAFEASNNPRFHGMTYEQGVRDAIEWVLGEVDTLDIEE